MNLLVFFTALIISFILTPLMIVLGPKLGIADAPGGRRQHQGVTSRMGGVAIFAGFMIASLLIFALYPPTSGSHEQKLLIGVMVGAVYVFIFGLADDIFDLPAWSQFAAQFGVALIAIGFALSFLLCEPRRGDWECEINYEITDI